MAISIQCNVRPSSSSWYSSPQALHSGACASRFVVARGLLIPRRLCDGHPTPSCARDVRRQSASHRSLVTQTGTLHRIPVEGGEGGYGQDDCEGLEVLG